MSLDVILVVLVALVIITGVIPNDKLVLLLVLGLVVWLVRR